MIKGLTKYKKVSTIKISKQPLTIVENIEIQQSMLIEILGTLILSIHFSKLSCRSFCHSSFKKFLTGVQWSSP